MFSFFSFYSTIYILYFRVFALMGSDCSNVGDNLFK